MTDSAGAMGSDGGEAVEREKKNLININFWEQRLRVILEC